MELKIFSGQASRELTEKICRELEVRPGESKFTRFADKEFEVRFMENIRGRDVYIVQSTYAPADNLMELLLWLDAAKRSRAGSITAVIPYYGWGRGDRKAESRVPISAKLVADLITTAGAKCVMTVDFHAAQEQGFFNIPVDHLYARPEFIKFFTKRFNPEDFIVLGPDIGAARLAKSYIRRLNNRPIALADKIRATPNQIEAISVVGDVQGKNVLIVDDIIDTAGTIVGVTEKLKQMGVRDIYAFGTHGLFSKDAVSKIEKSALTRVFTTDTVPLKNITSNKIEVISIASLLAEAIKRSHNDESISSLFE